MKISLPQLSLVVLIGASGSGKSTFARRHFLPTEILSSDVCRGLVSDDEQNQAATPEAFAVLGCIASKRLAAGRLTVIDATNVQPDARRPLVELSRQFHVLPVAIVLDLPERICQSRNAVRPERNFGPHVVRQQISQLRRSLRGLAREGFRHVFTLETLEQIEAAAIERVPLWNDQRNVAGPFDIIGDVHGCADELEALLVRLGYAAVTVAEADPLWGDVTYVHPLGRQAVFVGDLVDRGPRSLDTVRIVRNMVVHGAAYCVPGNHDVKLLRKLRGRDVQINHGLAETLAELEALPDEVRGPFTQALAQFIDDLVSHYVFDAGKLVVAHAGLKAEMHGRGSRQVRDFALYGETTGEIDAFGLPVRYNWASEYRGAATVVYGHTPVPRPEWLNRTINIDTGCVFGGALTALRYPENELVSVPAARVYAEPVRPFLPAAVGSAGDASLGRSAQHAHDDLLDAEDVRGKRIIHTRLRGNVTIREAHAAAALEVMSRFAVNPKWLIYLPPTMSPCETSRAPGLLEHPTEAFAYFRQQGATELICEEKHMGSRAVAIVCRTASEAALRFGVTEGESGAIYTRTGRPFFSSRALEHALLERLQAAIGAADLWNRLETTWLCLDCELMPWSAKAQELLQHQYAAVGAAGRTALPPAIAALAAAQARLTGDAARAAEQMRIAAETRHEHIEQFVAAYRRYCWPVQTLDDLKLAPFHLLASEGGVHIDRPHAWHMEQLHAICREDAAILRATDCQHVDLHDPASEQAAVDWWTALTEQGGEGMVVKPRDFLLESSRGLAQPAVKCRGREYLRIIYGPDYTADEHLMRLRARGLARKQSLALGEFALGIEALERFVRREPLRHVHECVFGVLALESEPVDPRL